MTLVSKSLSGVALAGMAIGVVAFNPESAFAATSCTNGATLVSPGVCQLVVTSSGTVSFQSGISKLTAVLVGGGGGSYIDVIHNMGIAGGGGQVVYTELLNPNNFQNVTIGDGGADNPWISAFYPNNGAATSIGSVVALPGYGSNTFTYSDLTDPNTGASGSGNTGGWRSGSFDWIHTGGGGAKAATLTEIGGAGYKLSEIPGVDSSLWPASSDENIDPEVGRGGYGVTATPPTTLTSYGFGGGSGHPAGFPGVVIFRYALPTDPVPPSNSTSSTSGLATTGLNSSPLFVAGFSLMSLGAALVIVMRKFRNSVKSS